MKTNTKLLILVALIFGAVLATAQMTSHTSNTGYLHEQARQLYNTGDYRGALSIYETILRSHPSDGTALDLAAWCRRYIGDLQGAEDTFKKALNIFQGTSANWLYVGLGETYLEGGDYANALDLLQKVLQPESGNAVFDVRVLRDVILAGTGASIDVSGYIGRLESLDPVMSDVVRQEMRRLENLAPDTTADSPSSGLDTVTRRQGNVFFLYTDDGTVAAPGALPSPDVFVEGIGKPEGLIAWNMPLGENIWTGLESLRKAGYTIGVSPLVIGDRTYRTLNEAHMLDMPAELLEGSTGSKVYITEYKSAILSVIMQIDYAPEYGYERLQDLLRRNAGQLFGEGGMQRLKTIVNLFTYEMGSPASREYGVWTRLVERTHLNKTHKNCSLEIEHINLQLLNDYLNATQN